VQHLQSNSALFTEYATKFLLLNSALFLFKGKFSAVLHLLTGQYYVYWQRSTTFTDSAVLHLLTAQYYVHWQRSTTFT